MPLALASFQRLYGLDAASQLSDPIMIGLWARNANNGFDHAALWSANAIQRIPILLDPNCCSFLATSHQLSPLPHSRASTSSQPYPSRSFRPTRLLASFSLVFWVSPTLLYFSFLPASDFVTDFPSFCAPPGCHGDPKGSALRSYQCWSKAIDVATHGGPKVTCCSPPRSHWSRLSLI